MKKVAEADLVLNVICTEQNLPQEKVMLSLQAVGTPGRPQLHLAYELVKLTKGKDIVRMSGRRGIYVLADALYEDLRKASLTLDVKKKQVVDDAARQQVAHVVASAAMKYSLLSVSTRMEIAFDVEAAVNPKGNSAAFILYSGARIESIIRKFDEAVIQGKYEPAPPDIDWSLLNDPSEWFILTKFLLPFASLIVQAALPPIPAPPKLAEFGTHVIPQFAYELANEFSSYYGRVKILCGGPQMYARIRFCRAVQQVIKNALRLFMVDPLDAM
jgi:arginyl-tRNA synthetase